MTKNCQIKIQKAEWYVMVCHNSFKPISSTMQVAVMQIFLWQSSDFVKCTVISINFLRLSLTARHICICSIFTLHNLQVAALSKVEGDVVGQTVRRILWKISTAGAWSEYSRVGKVESVHWCLRICTLLFIVSIAVILGTLNPPMLNMLKVV